MCSICGRYDGMHDYRCPYYSPLRPKYLCCYCGEGIYQGERYLDNETENICMRTVLDVLAQTK